MMMWEMENDDDVGDETADIDPPLVEEVTIGDQEPPYSYLHPICNLRPVFY